MYIFVTKNVLFLVQNKSQSATFNQKQHIFCHKNAYLENSNHQKMFGPLFSDSAYFFNSKTTFGMFGMICFGVDSQAHTL
jgi:hypothetical protein